MIYLKTEEEIELIRLSSLLVGKTHGEISKHIKPGVTTNKLDQIAEEFIRDNGGVPAFKGYSGFPASLCISIDEAVVHGIPNDQPLEEGMIISVDCGVKMNGYYGDSAYTYPVGAISEEKAKLLKVTKECLSLCIENAIVGNRIGDIGFACQSHAEKHGYGVVRELVGHGVGKNLHEKPEVPNYGRRGSGLKLKEGMVLAIEPMINMGVKNVQQLNDGWTIVTADRKPSAHFEHTVAIRKNKAEILSSFDFIKEETLV